MLDLREPDPEKAVKYKMHGIGQKTRQRGGSRSGWTRTTTAAAAVVASFRNWPGMRAVQSGVCVIVDVSGSAE